MDGNFEERDLSDLNKFSNESKTLTFGAIGGIPVFPHYGKECLRWEYSQNVVVFPNCSLSYRISKLGSKISYLQKSYFWVCVFTVTSNNPNSAASDMLSYFTLT